MSRKILLVDDDPIILRIVAALLRREGYDVATAENLQDMIWICNLQNFELFVLDMMLPDGNGLECCRFVRERSSAPIIMLTSRDGPLEKVAALDLGANDYITKPFEPSELAARIRVQFRNLRQTSPIPLKPIQISTPQRIGPYALKDKLGEGGMGAVYLAENASGEKVALKVLSERHRTDAQLVSRFRREAKTLISLEHPNLVKGLDAGVVDGIPYFVMERLIGETVETAMALDLKFEVARAIEVVIQVARGLQYAHQRGIVHRDIKPANLFLTRNGPVKILDLGLSRDFLRTAAHSFATEPGQVLGTPEYIAPEQARGAATDGRTDIYALGATMYHMISGRMPYEGSAISLVMQSISAAPPDPRILCPELRPGVADVMMTMMSKQPEQRFQDCGEVIAALERCVRAG